MAVVALIPTGKMEHSALGPSLQRIFPGHTFVVRPPEKLMDGFTSCDVSQATKRGQTKIPALIENLASTLVNAIYPSRKSGPRIDFAYVIEDVELCNQAHPERILSAFRTAVEQCINSQWPQQTELRFRDIANQCSFHLFRPMTEAYFFGEPNALVRAKAHHGPDPLPVNADLENFQTTDTNYLALPPNKLIADMPDRAHHPKSYVQYLCNPSLSANRKQGYRETHNGCDALRTLDWESVCSRPPHCPFLTAFLDDLCDALNSPLPFVNQNHTDPRVRVFALQNRILRNI